MKYVLAFTMILLAAGPVLAQQVPGSKPITSLPTSLSKPVITFDNIKYVFASASSQGQTITNEYVPNGETLKNWTTLIGVRHFRRARELKDVLPNYFAIIKPVLCAEPLILEKSGVDDEVTLVLWLKAPDNSYVEYNLHRFVRTSRGVIAYQFAQKLPFKEELNVTPVMEKQAHRIEELGDVSFQVYDK